MTPTQTLASVSARTLTEALKSGGIFLALPPFVVRISSAIPVVVQGLRAVYGRHHILRGDSVFADFHVEVKSEWRLFKRVCVFEMDGFQPFTPLAYGEAFAFLEWGMNWCVTSHCHNWLTIHSAVLEKNGNAVILPAPPGSGKSTLCAALMLHGWRLLSDEMALLDPSTGLVTPAPRPVSLKNHSIEVIRQRASGVSFGPLAYDTLKGTVAHMQVSASSMEHANEPVLPAWIVFPKYRAGAPLTVAPRPMANALVDLTANSFNHHVHGRSGFEALTRLVDQCSCHDLEYSLLDEALAWFDTLAESSA